MEFNQKSVDRQKSQLDGNIHHVNTDCLASIVCKPKRPRKKQLVSKTSYFLYLLKVISDKDAEGILEGILSQHH